MVTILLSLITVLLVLILLVLVNLFRELERQHRELIKFVDALAEMVGEAIDQQRSNRESQ